MHNTHLIYEIFEKQILIYSNNMNRSPEIKNQCV